MPVIKSAKKKARQALRHQVRNQAMRTQVKTFMKKMEIASKTSPDEAKKLLPLAYKVIDMACKKNILHRNNADRKKSLLAKMAAGKAGVNMAAAKKEAKKA